MHKVKYADAIDTVFVLAVRRQPEAGDDQTWCRSSSASGSKGDNRLKYTPHRSVNRHWTIAAVLHVHVHDMAGGARRAFVIGVQGSPAAYARVAQLGRAYAGVDGVREADRATYAT